MWHFIFLMAVVGIILSIAIAEFFPHKIGSAATIFWNTLFAVSAFLFCICAFAVMLQGATWFIGKVLP